MKELSERWRSKQAFSRKPLTLIQRVVFDPPVTVLQGETFTVNITIERSDP